ncbi:MAG: HK97 gp10 family phage protein [Planctomycetaceae bacterium]|nr:HK97 gp10 family phage protein [Planctomycetaceae bacterium]
MIEVKFEMEGWAEMEAALERLPAEVSRKVLDRALKKVSAPVVEYARRAAPRSAQPRVTGSRRKYLVRYPHMADSIKVRSAGLTEDGVTVWIGPDPKMFWGWFQEFGHAVVVAKGTEEVDRTYRHWRGTARAGNQELVTTSRRKTRKSLVHVGHAPARPFLRPAIDSTRSFVLEGLKDAVLREIDAAALRVARQRIRSAQKVIAAFKV